MSSIRAAVENFKRVIVLVAIVCLATLPAIAQRGTGSISGVVQDPSGRAVVGADIQITNNGTGYITKTKTVDDGGYVFPNVPLGTYEIRVAAAGFKTEAQSNIQVTIGASVSDNFKLTVGSVSETVSVTADAILLDTASNDVSKVISEKSITELPLNGRNPATLVLISPGVTPQVGGGIQGLTTHPSSTIASANGGRQGNTGYLLDGADNVDQYMGSAQPFPNPEATQEFRVSNLNYSAELQEFQ